MSCWFLEVSGDSCYKDALKKISLECFSLLAYPISSRYIGIILKVNGLETQLLSSLIS